MEFVKPANSNNLLKNTCLPFMLEDSGIRGRFVRIDEELHNILSRHRYPQIVSKMVGELLVLVTMLGSMLKIKGMVSIQVQGDEAVKFISADYNDQGHLRGYAKINDRNAINLLKDKQSTLKQIFGKGFMMITIENDGEKPYQALVPIEGKTLTDCMAGYFKRSEQLNAYIYSSVAQKNGKWHAGGILLQKIALEGGKNKISAKQFQNKWDSAKMFLDSLTDEELLNTKLPANELLYKLFNEHGVRVFDALNILAKCRCSREKMQNALDGISQEQLDDLKVDGFISMKCQFCGHEEKF